MRKFCLVSNLLITCVLISNVHLFSSEKPYCLNPNQDNRKIQIILDDNDFFSQVNNDNNISTTNIDKYNLNNLKPNSLTNTKEQNFENIFSFGQTSMKGNNSPNNYIPQQINTLNNSCFESLHDNSTIINSNTQGVFAPSLPMNDTQSNIFLNKKHDRNQNINSTENFLIPPYDAMLPRNPIPFWFNPFTLKIMNIKQAQENINKYTDTNNMKSHKTLLQNYYVSVNKRASTISKIFPQYFQYNNGVIIIDYNKNNIETTSDKSKLFKQLKYLALQDSNIGQYARDIISYLLLLYIDGKQINSDYKVVIKSSNDNNWTANTVNKDLYNNSINEFNMNNGFIITYPKKVPEFDKHKYLFKDDLVFLHRLSNLVRNAKIQQSAMIKSIQSFNPEVSTCAIAPSYEFDQDDNHEEFKGYYIDTNNKEKVNSTPFYKAEHRYKMGIINEIKNRNTTINSIIHSINQHLTTLEQSWINNKSLSDEVWKTIRSTYQEVPQKIKDDLQSITNGLKSIEDVQFDKKQYDITLNNSIDTCKKLVAVTQNFNKEYYGRDEIKQHIENKIELLTKYNIDRKVFDLIKEELDNIKTILNKQIDTIYELKVLESYE